MRDSGRLSNQPMKDPGETICALSTPPGRSGVAVVRVSGPATRRLISRIFQPKNSIDPLPARRATLGRIVDPRDGTEIDEGIATFFAGPHSYTGEDLCELGLHGNPVLVFALLDALCSEGARLAEPGEFTLRAFLNGRMDLAQAEAVRDIIEASTRYQAQVAARQRSGELAREIGPVKQALIDIIVNLESAVEFAEELLSVKPREELQRKVEETRALLRRWIASFRQGRVIRDGFSLAVVGRPNVGKSSLFNALLARERSIVTEIAGTTRDLVSEYTSIGGIPVHLRDTAGICESASALEKLGIERSMQAIADSDAVLLVADLSRPPSEEDWEMSRRLGESRAIVVMNKADLCSRWTADDIDKLAAGRPWLEVSAREMTGIDRLRSLLLEQLLGPSQPDGLLVTNLRHCRSLEEAEQALGRAEQALAAGLSEEFALVDLHTGLQKLGSITGETGVEDILSEMFSQFCVGK